MRSFSWDEQQTIEQQTSEDEQQTMMTTGRLGCPRTCVSSFCRSPSVPFVSQACCAYLAHEDRAQFAVAERTVCVARCAYLREAFYNDWCKSTRYYQDRCVRQWCTCR